MLWSYRCSLQVITSLMITIVEPTVQLLVSLMPHFHDFTAARDSSAAGLVQVETFLRMFSVLLDHHFTHNRKKPKPFEGSSVAGTASANRPCVEQAGRCSVTSSGRSSSVAVDSLSNASSDDCRALKRLLAFAYIWGFGLSLLDRCRIVIILIYVRLLLSIHC